MKIAFPIKFFSLRSLLTLLLFFFLLWYFLYIDFYVRLATLATGLLIVLCSMVLVWKFRIFRWALVVIYVLALLFLLLPGRASKDTPALRDAYCNALQAYSGCRYVWGGEGYLGIDCSGLVQKGLEDALTEKGLLTLNPALVRQAVDLYWHRTNARVIGEGYFGKTFEITTCPTLNKLDYSRVMPGDLAVTSGGDHVMAYLGNKTWIAADPGEGKVTKFTIPEEKNAYFSTPMRIVRWKILSD